MKKRHYNTLSITVQNLRRRLFRTISLIILIALFAFVLFGGSMVSYSLYRGLDSMSKRLGADIMVVPAGYDRKAQGMLLRGEPSTFYLDGALAEKLSAVEGVQDISAQLFIASLSAECCSSPIQIIGFDPESDFVIKPWFKTDVPGGIPDGGIVVGSDVSAGIGEEIKLFGRAYTVVARLDKTGLGYDTSVFMNMSTALGAVEDYTAAGGMFPPPDGRVISSVMIGVRSGYSVNKAAVNISKALSGDGVQFIVADDMFKSISDGLDTLLTCIFVIAAVIWVISVFVLALVFSVTANERKREFGIYRALGATRKKLRNLIFAESAVISLSGTAAGTFLAGLLFFPFSTYIGISLKMPYVQPSFGAIVLILLASLIVSFWSAPLAAAFSAFKIGRSETYDIIRGEAT